MDNIEQAEQIFQQLQKYVPFLKKFSESIKQQAKTNDEFAKKYAKAEHLLEILKGGCKR